jgi:TonB family protein
VVSYVVLEDGSTTDPVVESSSGVRDLERSAIRAVRNWRFEPATRNGQPVQQCDARTRLVFQLDLPGHQRGVTRSFRSEWERIGDREVERSMLEAQLALELQLGEYRRATETAKTLLEEHGGDVSDERLEAVVSELLELQYGRNYVSVSGYIGDWTALDEQQPFWTHTLLRHRFGLEDIEGEVRALDIRCDTQRVLIEFEPDVAWNTQEDWGSCDVHVHGTPGTRFKLVEYPVAAAEAAGR